MIRKNFLNPQQREELEQITRRAIEPHGVARRANAILLLDDGFSCAQIARVLYLDDDTIRTFYKHYMMGGFDALERFDWKGGKPLLDERQQLELADFLDENLHTDTRAIRVHIGISYGQYYSHSGCAKLLKRLGFEYKKPPRIAAQADEAAQAKFITDYANLKRGLGEDEAIYFADAVHPEYQSKPAYGWFKKGAKVALKSTSSRQRMNIHGAINLENFDCPFMEVETVDAESTIALLKKIEQRNCNKTKVYVILDNARYHHAAKVRDWLARTKSRIRLIFLPAYAPHLNPIERLWGVMHKQLTHNICYPNFRVFADTILGFFKKTLPKHWPDFRDQISDNFRVISHKDFRVLE